jgi:hypothetical protein
MSKGKGNALAQLSKIPLHKATRDSADKFFEELDNASDRAVALMAVSAVDQVLVDLLLSRFVPLSDTEIEAQFFGKNANFGTFSIRTDLCYMLGLIHKGEKRDLDIMRRVRNAFAHGTEPLTFESDPVKAAVLSLSYVKHAHPDGQARDQFIGCAASYHVSFVSKVNDNLPLLLKALPVLETLIDPSPDKS